MLRLHQLELSLDDAATFDPSCLRRLCAQRLHLSEKAVAEARLVKRSVDARKPGWRAFFSDGGCHADPRGLRRRKKRLAARFKPNQVTVISGPAAGETPDVFGLKLPPWACGIRGDRWWWAQGRRGCSARLALAARGARAHPGGTRETRGGPLAGCGATGNTRGDGPRKQCALWRGRRGRVFGRKAHLRLNSPHIRTVLGTLVRCGAPEEILVAPAAPYRGPMSLRRVLVGHARGAGRAWGPRSALKPA